MDHQTICKSLLSLEYDHLMLLFRDGGRAVTYCHSWYSPVRNRRPPDYLFFSKNAYQDILTATRPPAFYFFEPRGHCPNQTQNCPVKIIHGQTLCPLFVVLKKCYMTKSQFPHHSRNHVRREWNKLPQDTTEELQFFQPLPSPLFSNPHPFIATPFYSGLESSKLSLWLVFCVSFIPKFNNVCFYPIINHSHCSEIPLLNQLSALPKQGSQSSNVFHIFDATWAENQFSG